MTSNPSTSGYRWLAPKRPSESDEKHQLKILNSFSRKKELFLANSNTTIKWYSCGPTVYDVSHLGHARCYITFDILRRILTDYFGYQVFYVMNITDIDDKIIKRARSNYLCDRFINQFVEGLISKEIFSTQVREALENYKKRLLDEKDLYKIDMINNIVKTSNEALIQLEQFTSSVDSQEHLRHILDELRDVIAEHQDNKLAHTVTDHSIYKKLTLKYEQEFHDDMMKLNVLPPNALTRVSEYIEEIVEYIEKLESNGFAYRSNGSVYFDTNKFDSDPKHSYAKLVREAFGHKKSLDDGEGELSVSEHQDTRRSPNDFALWKKSKTGEPSWSGFEGGRPGWHIECSVMASNLLGDNFDLHSGGCDLKFPHHDNEIAQAEAYYNTGKNWVNYFLHSGHLSISGCKMSKSLKNFVTIRQALHEYSARQLRFAFLAHSWAETLDYSPNTMNTAISYEKTFQEFFLNIVDTLRRRSKRANTDEGANSYSEGREICAYFKKWSPEDQQLNHEFMLTVGRVDEALCDNFDTRSTLNALSALAKECNKRPDANLILLRDIASYISHLLNIFGTNFDDIKQLDSLLMNYSKLNIEPNQATSNTVGDSETIFKYVEALAQFRADVRRISKTGTDPKQSVKQILALCDTLRDQKLPDLGVRLEDKEVEGASYVVKLVDAETIARERALANRREEEKKIKEEKAKIEKLKLQQQREEKTKMPPDEMFKSQTEKYSKFDEVSGLPTHDAEGKELSKSALKKVQRLYAEQKERYDKFMREQQRTNA